MRITVSSALFLCACLTMFPALTFAQLDKEQTKLLRSVRLEITKAEGKLKYAQDLADRSEVKGPTVATINRELDKADEFLGEAKKGLEGLPASASEVAPVLARHGELVAQSKKLREFAAGKSSEFGKENETLEAGLEVDAGNMRAFMEQIENLQSEGRQKYEVSALLANWSAIRKNAEELVGKYSELRGTSKEANRMVMETKILKSRLDQVAYQQEQDCAQVPGELDSMLTQAKKFADEAVGSGSFGQFLQFVNPTVEWASNLITNHVAFCKDHPKFDGSLEGKTRARIAELVAIQKAHEQKIIASNTLPKETYAGGDKGALSAKASQMIAEKFPSRKVLKTLVVGSGWKRNSGWRWDSADARWVRYDHSAIVVNVYVASPDGKEVYEYWVMATKNHLNGDSISYMRGICQDRPENPSEIYLRSLFG